MKYVFLDGEKIGSNAAMHRVFAEALGFPEYYGKNLDALHDLLTETPEPLTVIAVNTEALQAHISRSWNGFLRLMNDLAEERDGFTFLFEPFGE